MQVNKLQKKLFLINMTNDTITSISELYNCFYDKKSYAYTSNLKNNSYKFFSYLDATVEDVIYEDQEVEKDIRTEEFIFKFDKEGHIVLK